MNNLSSELTEGAERTLSYFESKLLANGSYDTEVIDIAAYYKSPMMFVIAKKPNKALQILDYVKTNFMQTNGDFLSSISEKSINPAYSEFWTYTNGWIVRAAQLLGHEDISIPASAFLDKFKSPIQGGFLTHQLASQDGVTDVLTAAHNGLIHLERGDIETAVNAGHYLCDVIELQPNLSDGFYLRLDSQKKLITSFTKDKEAFHWVNRTKPDQLYFMIGYSIGYLGLLFQRTKDEKFLDAAHRYVDFVLSCHENIFSSNFSHKIAWACSVLFSIRPDEKLKSPMNFISHHFLASQSKEGIWFLDQDINTAYDQSAELACWFLEIAKNIEIGLKHTHTPRIR
ncbi:MAG TPA: hypothetical protein VGH95_03490 [Candidatus Aquirickettsiella sp.]|jgi:hypothetical protein